MQLNKPELIRPTRPRPEGRLFLYIRNGLSTECKACGGVTVRRSRIRGLPTAWNSYLTWCWALDFWKIARHVSHEQSSTYAENTRGRFATVGLRTGWYT